jgi:small-conductance mechanosensitive channel
MRNDHELSDAEKADVTRLYGQIFNNLSGSSSASSATIPHAMSQLNDAQLSYLYDRLADMETQLAGQEDTTPTVMIDDLDAVDIEQALNDLDLSIEDESATIRSQLDRYRDQIDTIRQERLSNRSATPHRDASTALGSDAFSSQLAELQASQRSHRLPSTQYQPAATNQTPAAIAALSLVAVILFTQIRKRLSAGSRPGNPRKHK